MQRLAPLLLALLACPSAQAQVAIAWRTDLPRNGIEEARALQRCALIYFSDGSQACRDLEARVFSDPNVALALRELVPIRADCSVPGAHQELQERHSVSAYPTVVFFDTLGNAVDRMGDPRPGPFRGQVLRVLREHWRPDAGQDPAPTASPTRSSPPPRSAPSWFDVWVNQGGWMGRFLVGMLLGAFPCVVCCLRGRPGWGLGMALLGSGAGSALTGPYGVLATSALAVLASSRPRGAAILATTANLTLLAMGAGFLGWVAVGVLRPGLLPAQVRPPTGSLALDFETAYREWDGHLKAGRADEALAVVDEMRTLGTPGYERDLDSMAKLARRRGADDPGERGPLWIAQRLVARKQAEGKLRDAFGPPGAGLVFLVLGLYGFVAQKRALTPATPPPWAEGGAG